MNAKALPVRAIASTKIREYHWERLAIVYVRQSTPQQILDHRESTARQYALADRAVDLGWPRERVLVIDEDQGQSGQSAAGRPGFQRLLAEIGLDHVGLVLGLEMSRLARSCKDWHQLLELCGVFRTLLADTDGLYDPSDYNDRLLLGLKGTMSEAELHILKSRMLEGTRNKARRGQMLNFPPMGYVRAADGDYELDPDEQAQSVVRMIFDVFERQGSIHGLLRWLKAHDVRMPIRQRYGPDRGRLEWRRPCQATLHNLLHHPIYAGAYRWGHRVVDPRRQKPGKRNSGRITKPLAECQVLLKDRFPAYISWERFEAIQKRLAENRAASGRLGAPREGPSLLAGLLVCGRCGHRLTVHYSPRLRYACDRAKNDYAEPMCLGVAGELLDAFVAEQVLEVLQPASLELSLAAEADLRGQRQQLEEHWNQRLERAAFEVDRAARQYATVEPENRLVARVLESRWEEALARERDAEEEYERFQREQPNALNSAQREAILGLSKDVSRIWDAATTTIQDRQEIVRLLLDRVVVNVEGDSERVDLALHWAGGTVSSHRLVRTVARYTQLSNYDALRERLKALRKQGLNLVKIAENLNRERFHPPKRTARFSSNLVSKLLSDFGAPGRRPRAMGDSGVLEEHEHWLADLAAELHIALATLRRWQRFGWVHGRKLQIAAGRWAIWADADEVSRLLRLRSFRRQWPNPAYPAELTTPKARCHKA
jgi:DNA invertase Pin-like site-specific DNA recombinase